MGKNYKKHIGETDKQKWINYQAKVFILYNDVQPLHSLVAFVIAGCYSVGPFSFVLRKTIQSSWYKWKPAFGVNIKWHAG